MEGRRGTCDMVSSQLSLGLVLSPYWPSVGCTSVHFVDTVLDGRWQVGPSRRCFGTVERSKSRRRPSSCWLDGKMRHPIEGPPGHFVDMLQDGCRLVGLSRWCFRNTMCRSLWLNCVVRCIVACECFRRMRIWSVAYVDMLA